MHLSVPGCMHLSADLPEPDLTMGFLPVADQTADPDFRSFVDLPPIPFPCDLSYIN